MRRDYQVARAGEHFVAAELNRRGAYAVTFAGNMPKIDIIACNQDQSRTVHIQVKSKHSRTWQTSIVGAEEMVEPSDPLAETVFWVFVDLGNLDAPPRYWIVPSWWIRNNIYQTHNAYLARHGGTRARNPNSKHHAIDERRVAAWEAKWEVLGIF
jgi:hypothetical protein